MNVKQYQYKGQDLSPLYKYVLSPWADFCVRYFTPKWVAYVSCLRARNAAIHLHNVLRCSFVHGFRVGALGTAVLTWYVF